MGSAALLLPLVLSGLSNAAEISVAPGGLADALAQSAPGDVLTLAPGVYAGPLEIARPLTLRGEAGTVIRGNGAGSVIRIAAPDVTVAGLTITGSGLSLETEDSGIFVTRDGDRAVMEGNVIVGNLIGVFLKGPDDAAVRDNRIEGQRDMHMSERGNGVQLWNSPGSVVENNSFRFGRDGIFVGTSRDNVFRNNRFQELRFAVHYMYTNRSEVSENVSIGNHVGYAVMYSRHVEVLNNRSRGDRDHGILLNYANSSTIAGNDVSGGAHKCVFVYNANKNRFADNRFAGCDIGVHFTAGSERNRIAGNAFIGNRTQVKYVGTRQIEWSEDGRGNHWSDHTAFDLDGDGIADRPYRPNNAVDRIVWRHPLAKLLLNSPSTQLVAWAQSAFPTLLPGGVTDSAPLMDVPGAETP
ncbi:MAG: nitrous oxide reductase family maturation protein NosD [Sphingomonadales bacterium]|nr:nitrous oxide reductase family maturation protein NosD [Sphingomonadales bacterium]